MATEGPSRRLFDVWSTFYDLPLVQRLTYQPVQDAVVAALRPHEPRRVLDVGCGTGLLATRLRPRLPPPCPARQRSEGGIREGVLPSPTNL